jgi:type II secretory pathway component PulK
MNSHAFESAAQTLPLKGHCGGIRPRRGAILVIVIVVTMSLAATVLVMCRSMRVEAMASANQAASVQANAIERGAEQYLQAMLVNEGNTNIDDVTEDQFAGVQIGDGYFWVLRPDFDDPTLPVFGMVKEGAKLNLNTASYDQLMRLPGMLDRIAGSWVDWRDADSNPSTSGDETYAKNAPFEAVEEVLMTQGGTPQELRELLYGIGGAPPLGEVSSGTAKGFNGTQYNDPQLARGIFDLLTIWSADTGADSSGQAKVNPNTAGRSTTREKLRTVLSQAEADRIANSMPSRRNNTRGFLDIFDFFTKQQVKQTDMDTVNSVLTFAGTQTTRGRIDVDAAPRAVLLTLNGLTEEDVDKLIANRQTNNTPGSISWVSTALGTKAVGIGNQITTSSSQFSGDILAVSGNGRAFKRVKIVIDNSSGTPQIVFRRDLTDRGWPMDPQILASIRAGQGPGSWGGSSRSGSQMGSVGGAF